MKTTRIPHAPSTPLPELAGFRAHFHRSEGAQSLERYLTGLLTEHLNKNCDTLAQVVPGTSEQRFQGLLTTLDWDEDDLNRQRVQTLLRLPSEGDGVLSVDDTGFAKQGHCSVGVARQDSGTLGKVGNCQVTVNCHYAERTLAWPVATRLSRPAPWADDADRRTKAQVPEGLAFRTKPQIALELLDRAKGWGVRWACVTADADQGDNPNFLGGLEQRRQRYVVAVRADFAVSLARRGGEARRADVLVAAQAVGSWHSVTWREGSQGWMRGKCVACRGWRVTSSGLRRAGWLIGEEAADGRRRYSWSNFGPGMALEQMVESAHRRHGVERYHEEAQGLLG
ncbi:MAG: IS701 family transposase, partial [Planctomycetaceae bacterium]|nr:IS701 family transposase [Planctomycetaceae bacterium]